MSDLSGLPAFAIARAASNAAIQSIAVRILNLPENLQSNPQPVNLHGVIQGQNSDGSVKVQTERGIVDILLKDRGNLPLGQTIDIEIPAGRPPQQAFIKPQTTLPVLQNPNLQIPDAATAATAANLMPPVKLERSQPLRSNDMAEALISAIQCEEVVAAAPLQVGQTLRLLPVSLPFADDSENFAVITLPPEILFNSIIQAVAQDTELPQQIKQDLVQILSKTDLSTLFVPTLNKDFAQPQQILTKAFEKILQQFDLPANLKLRNSLPTIPNPNRPLDVKILAFQSGTFAGVLESLPTPGQALGTTPVIDLKNFTVLPQPALAADNLPEEIPEGAVSAVIPKTPVSANPPSSPMPNSVRPSAAPSLLGQVIGFTPSGQPVISLALPGSAQPQTYAVQFMADNLVPGAPVIVSPIGSGEISTGPGFVPFAIDNIPLAEWAKADNWTSLQSLMTTISHLNPGMAQSMIQMLPCAVQPHNLGPLGMLFIAMMRSGEFSEWIGQPALNLLKENGKIDLLRALSGEMALSAKLENTALPGDWKAAMFPFWHDNQISKMPVYYKQWSDDTQDGDETDRKKKTRFMFELKLSRMGPVQVDGFMQTKKLDMILRTKSIISASMQDALRKTYHASMERSNLSGEMTFQFKPEQWVSIEMPA